GVDELEDLEAVELGHLDVEEDRLRIQLSRRLHRLETGRALREHAHVAPLPPPRPAAPSATTRPSPSSASISRSTARAGSSSSTMSTSITPRPPRAGGASRGRGPKRAPPRAAPSRRIAG